MRISEIVSKSGMSKDTIRFYEKKGLIKVGRTNSEWNNYKEYTDEVLEHLLLIKKAKGFGFTLNEISELLSLMKNNQATCEILSSKIQSKLIKIDNKIKELKTLKKMILTKIESVNGTCNSENINENCNDLSKKLKTV